MKDFYTAQWPKYDLYIECFVHSIMNFRYHWHQDDFELSILLHGKQYFCRGKENFCLEEDDVILVDANEGHASYGQETNTKALVLHFSSKALRQFLRKGEMYSFSQCCSDADTRDSLVYQRIRFYAAQIIRALSEGEIGRAHV